MDISYNTKPQYRFPILKDKEIIECLTDAGIEVSSNELMEPNRHKDKVKAIFLELVSLVKWRSFRFVSNIVIVVLDLSFFPFYSLISKITSMQHITTLSNKNQALLGLNLPKDTFTTTSMSLMNKRQNLPHPELHEESLSNFKFIKALMKLMLVSGINDFTMRDLYAPTTKRFKRQLSGIINYIKFTIEKQASLFNEINDQKDDLIGQLLEVQQEQEMLNEQLRQVKEDADKRWNEAKVVDDDCGEIEVEIARQNKLQTSIRQESENLKKQANVLKDKIDTADLFIQELGVKERKLAAQVVESPDKLKEDIGIQSVRLEEERKLCHNAEQTAKKVNLKIKNVTKAQESVAETTNLIRQVIDIKAKYDKSCEESKCVEDRVNVNETELAKSRQLCEDLEYQFRQIGEFSFDKNVKCNYLILEYYISTFY